MKKNFIKIISSWALLGICSIMLLPVFALAQTEIDLSQRPVSAEECTSTGTDRYCLLAPLFVDGKEVKEVNLSGYAQGIFKVAIGIAIVFAVLFIVIGGIEYILGATPFAKGDGKEKITNAIGGLLLALSSYLILYTINPKLVEFNLNIPPIKRLQLDSLDNINTLAESLTKQAREARNDAYRLRELAADYRKKAEQHRIYGDTDVAETYDRMALAVEIQEIDLRTDTSVDLWKQRMEDAYGKSDLKTYNEYRTNLEHAYTKGLNELRAKGDSESSKEARLDLLKDENTTLTTLAAREGVLVGPNDPVKAQQIISKMQSDYVDKRVKQMKAAGATVEETRATHAELNAQIQKIRDAMRPATPLK